MDAPAAPDLLGHDVPVRLARPDDDAALVAAADEAFQRLDPGHRGGDVAAWRWKYRSGPEPGRNLIALDPQGRIRGHYGAVGQRLVVDGEELFVTHASDSLASGPAGPGLAGVRGFLAAGRAFAGVARRRDTFTWGLPIPRALRLGERFLGYRKLRAQLALVAPVDSAGTGPRPELRVDVRDAPPPGIDELAGSIARSEPGRARFARDAAWYAWRFRDHPRERYELFAIEDGRATRALAVYRLGRFDRFAGALVCDWLVAPGDRAAERALFAALFRRARFDRARRLIALWPESAPEWGRFRAAGFRPEPTRYPLVVRAWGPRFELDRLRERWTYTLGDTDLC